MVCAMYVACCMLSCTDDNITFYTIEYSIREKSWALISTVRVMKCQNAAGSEHTNRDIWNFHAMPCNDIRVQIPIDWWEGYRKVLVEGMLKDEYTRLQSFYIVSDSEVGYSYWSSWYSIFHESLILSSGWAWQPAEIPTRGVVITNSANHMMHRNNQLLYWCQYVICR